MGFPSKPFSLLLCLSFFLFANPAQSATDYNTLVYKGCAKQAFQDPTGVYSQALSALFGSLVSQSTKTKFFKTTTGTGQTTITGLFQCRGDLSTGDCYKCVSGLPVLTDKLCGKTIAARVQLFGCYILYEVSGFTQVSGMEMLFKTCGATNIAGSGFEERRDTAFSVMENGVVSGHGFYTTSYQSMYVLGQCEGDVGDSDCGVCVKNAAQRAQGNVVVGSTLIRGYRKAQLLRGLNMVGWNAMIDVYAQLGDKGAVLGMYNDMQAKGLVPDWFTLLAFLTAFCDAVGQAGRLEEVEQIAVTMPFEPDAAVWRTLLSSRAYHGAADKACEWLRGYWN
ncbi:hypothetical protein GH714_005422 [Hevea brasiliensis]|uniref:Gnk2-homologous domain-containing protein n=1 Tax=Hevea brasiliensis TaxID=3981 RepID=A0A6A6KC48_HEVBR|nr:hypothetical protein GH714_005422 [Hevea brasiliensis]